MAADLDEQVTAFRTRPLGDSGPFTFLAADALTMKVRENGRVVNAVVLVATGVNADGHREILGLKVATSETGAAWNAFFADLVARGLTSGPEGVLLVTSDAHAGLVEAIAANLPGAAWQRCRTHYAVNLMSVCPKSSWGWVKALLHTVYDQPDAEAVHAQYDRVLDALADKLPDVHDHLDDARADVLAFTAFPREVWRQIWSNNPNETTQPRDPPPHRRGRHLPRPRLRGPSGRRRLGRAARRMGRRPPLPRTRRAHPSPRRRTNPTGHRSRHRAARTGARSMSTSTPREHDLAVLTAGGHTGWWDDHGRPAPWPDDFFDPDTEWRPDTNNAPLAPGEQPF